jgi:transcriptional regulator with XRE-family HTH domain
MSQDPNPQKFETVPLGTYLRRVRQSHGLQLKDLASMANTTPALISRLETGASRPTLFAVVKVCTALGLDLESLSEVIGVASFMTEARKRRVQQAGNQENVLTIADVERFLELYHKDPAKAQEKLVVLYRQFLIESGKVADYEKAQQMAIETIAVSFDKPSSPNALKYPTDEISKDTILEVYIAGGVITNHDVGAYVRRSREVKGESLRELAAKAGIDFTLLARLERGEVESLKFDDLIKIDKTLGMVGDILSLAWSAGEFYTSLKKMESLQHIIPLLFVTAIIRLNINSRLRIL